FLRRACPHRVLHYTTLCRSKLTELLDEPVSTPERPDPVDPGRLRGEIEVDRVSFRYGPDTEHALRDITVHIEAGQTVALVGETGDRKSTRLNSSHVKISYAV